MERGRKGPQSVGVPIRLDFDKPRVKSAMEDAERAVLKEVDRTAAKRALMELTSPRIEEQELREYLRETSPSADA